MVSYTHADYVGQQETFPRSILLFSFHHHQSLSLTQISSFLNGATV